MKFKFIGTSPVRYGGAVLKKGDIVEASSKPGPAKLFVEVGEAPKTTSVKSRRAQEGSE